MDVDDSTTGDFPFVMVLSLRDGIELEVIESGSCNVELSSCVVTVVVAVAVAEGGGGGGGAVAVAVVVTLGPPIIIITSRFPMNFRSRDNSLGESVKRVPEEAALYAVFKTFTIGSDGDVSWLVVRIAELAFKDGG